MNEVRFETIQMPGAILGPAGDYPIMYKQKMFEKESVLDEQEGLFINFGNVSHCLPYTSQDIYDHSEALRDFEAAILENDCVKATFIPSLGGRLWSLYDKKNDRDLLIDNPVFRPCNLSMRNAWFCGGVEWNCGVRGHSALTCDRLFASSYRMKNGTPVLRMYAFERIRAVTFQMDFFLKEDCPYLFARMRIVNGSKRMTPIYWWSTIAVKLQEGARVVVSADEAYVNQGSDPVYKVAIPYDENGTDLSYPANHHIAIDHFYKIPENDRKYVAYIGKAGVGLMHASTRRLKGRKMFVWGTSRGGCNWQKRLTNAEGEKQPYLEIQAGLAPTQNESLPMPPKTAWEWLEVYAPVMMEPAAVHGDWESAKKNVGAWLDRAIPESEMDQILAETHEAAVSEVPAIYLGHSWGALDNELRIACGEQPIAPYLDFGTMRKEQLLWHDLLKNGYFAEPLPSEKPASFMVQDEWFELLKKAVANADKHNWYAWYHVGVCYFAKDMFEQSEAAFNRSLELHVSTWAYHGLANVTRVLGDDKRSAYLMAKAFSLNPKDLYIARETMRFAYEAGEFDLILTIYNSLDEKLRKEPSLLVYKAFGLAHTGDCMQAKALLLKHGGEEFVDRREGDDSIPEEYIYIETKLAEARGYRIDSASIDVPPEIDYRMFHHSKE